MYKMSIFAIKMRLKRVRVTNEICRFWIRLRKRVDSWAYKIQVWEEKELNLIEKEVKRLTEEE